MKKMLAEEKKWFEYIIDNYPKGTKLGLDPRLLTACISTLSQLVGSKEEKF